MLNLNADMVLCQLVDQFLDRKSPAEYGNDYHYTIRHGVVFTLDLGVSNYTDEESYHSGRQVMLLFTGNTSVFIAVAPEGKRYYGYDNVPLDAWENTSNHDSCWRSDGVNSPLSRLYFEMCDEINFQREANGLEKIAPVAMSQFNRLGHRLVEHVEVITESDRDTHNPSYFRKIVNINPKDNS